MAKHRTHGMACKRQIVQEYLAAPSTAWHVATTCPAP